MSGSGRMTEWMKSAAAARAVGDIWLRRMQCKRALTGRAATAWNYCNNSRDRILVIQFQRRTRVDITLRPSVQQRYSHCPALSALLSFFECHIPGQSTRVQQPSICSSVMWGHGLTAARQQRLIHRKARGNPPKWWRNEYASTVERVRCIYTAVERRNFVLNTYPLI